MMEKCKLCPNWLFCQMHGCTIWNDDARAKYRQEQQEQIDSQEAFDPIPAQSRDDNGW